MTRPEGRAGEAWRAASIHIPDGLSLAQRVGGWGGCWDWGRGRAARSWWGHHLAMPPQTPSTGPHSKAAGLRRGNVKVSISPPGSFDLSPLFLSPTQSSSAVYNSSRTGATPHLACKLLRDKQALVAKNMLELRQYQNSLDYFTLCSWTPMKIHFFLVSILFSKTLYKKRTLLCHTNNVGVGKRNFSLTKTCFLSVIK